MNTRTSFNELAPCGVFCGACPSFHKTCSGCASTERHQSRKSKWGCKIRICCYSEKRLVYCFDCEEFPCSKIRKKLTDSHPDDKRFAYRHEIPETFKMLQIMDEKEFINYHHKRWQCKHCGGTIQFYKYTCNTCGKEGLAM